MYIIKTIIICFILLIFIYLVSKILIGTHTIITTKDNNNIKDRIDKINIKNKAYNIFNKIKSDKNNKDNNYKNKRNIFKDFNKRVCIDHDNCIKNNKKYCTYGISNFIHPYYLNNIDKMIFMNTIQSNFTKQDYINWLNCYKNDKSKIKKLSYYNHKNLIKIKNNDYNITIPKIKKEQNKYINFYINN